MTLFKDFSKRTFLIILILISVLTFLSLLSAISRDEGTSGDNLLSKSLAYLFIVLRFPTHNLFWNYTNGWTLFLLGLVINCLIYSLLIERLFAIFRHFKTSSTRNPNRRRTARNIGG